MSRAEPFQHERASELRARFEPVGEPTPELREPEVDVATLGQRRA